MGRRWAWVLVGLALDAAALVALVSDLPRLSTLPREEVLDPLNPAVAGAALALAHGVVLPLLVWPNRGLSTAEAGWAAIVALIVGALLGLAAVLGFAAAFPLFVVLLNISRPAPPAEWVPILVAYAVAGGFILSSVARIVGWGGSAGWVRIGSPSWGGILGGLLLGGVWTVPQALGGEGAALVAAWILMLSAGLPHLLLSARRLPPDMAPLPVALRRAGVVLAMLATIGTALRVL